MNIVKYPDPRLKQICEAFTDAELETIRDGTPIGQGDRRLYMPAVLDEMLKTCTDAGGIGLAGPQVGIMRRVIAINCSGIRLIVLNPKITYRWGLQGEKESCLSFPGRRIFVERALRIGIKGFDHNGEPVEYKAQKLLARVYQHEIDHLDGICRVGPQEKAA